jgi:glycosyltransferase involved in cell wall biosynthesis
LLGKKATPPVSLALCHEWLSDRRGSEKTFEQMAQVFPGADRYALTWNRWAPLSFGDRPVNTTFLDRLPALRDRRALQLPLMPLAWRYATRREYDLVVTSSHACAKGFWPARKAVHLCYCYTPMRYVWLSSIDERRIANPLTRFAERALRSWDLRSVEWVDEFAAISTAVKRRIEDLYGRPARVIHPPVETDYFTPGPEGSKKEFALAVSRMVPYKRLDLAIRACHSLRYPLVLAGSGPEAGALRDLAARLGSPVNFVISPDDELLRDLYRGARISIFPAEEDFGIVAVESQACGTPVVALGRGGSLDTIVDRVTGILIPDQDEKQLTAGMAAALNGRLSASDCRQNAERFSQQRFRDEFRGWVLNAAKEHGIAMESLPVGI